MTALNLRISEEQKHYIKRKGTIIQTMKDSKEGNIITFKNFDDFCEQVKSW